MNLLNKLKRRFSGKNGRKSLALSIVILVEAVAIMTVATYAWVETVSSIKITNETNTTGTVDTYVFTEAMIGSVTGTIDIADYFKQAGDMHLAPASSADGKTMYFPKANLTTGFIYRKGNVSDKNTAYLSVSFKLRADTNADFFFEQVPTFSALGDDIRVSVTSQSEGSTAAPVTKIYANSASTTAVVNSTTGSTGATAVEAFSSHKKGSGSANRLFAVGANETKIITINVWLQKKTSANTDLTNNMSQAVTINNLGIISDLTPRHVTLLATPTWDNSNPTFYAWCWGATNGDADRLYKLELDEEEHYAFDYNGKYQNTLFIRSGNSSLTTTSIAGHWNDNTIWNVTEDTSIPNDPIDPTFIIETINGSSQNDTSSGTGSTNKKSTGSWHDPATVKVAYVNDQTTSWGTLTATSYVGTTTSSHVIEATNSSSTKHTDTVHAWPGKKLRLTAAAKTNYAFVGWYDNAEGTGTALSTSATYEPNAPSTATEVTYYAKFKETRTLTINKYVDGSSSATAAGTITIGSDTSAATVTSYTKTFDKGASVSFSATANTGYTLSGIYTTASGTTTASSPVTLNNNTTYYAKFTTNSYNVTTHAYYSTDGGSTYTADNSTGGTVKAGSSAAGATSTASVKYKNTVTLVASAKDGYQFAGWYNAASGGTQLSTSTSYTYTLSSASDADVYARFIGETWAIKYGASGASNWSTKSMTVSGNTVSGSLTLTEGQDFSFKITKTAGSDTTWYGGSSSGLSYSNITSTSFISNLTLTSTNGGNDIYMKGHAGTYTFTFNKSTNVLNVTASYSNITITFWDDTNDKWIGNDSAVVYYGSNEGWSGGMTKNGNQYTVSVPSNYCTNAKFQRRVNGTTYNTFSSGDRGYQVGFSARDNNGSYWY